MSDDMPIPIPRVEVHSTVRSSRERAGRYRLEGSRCSRCGALWFPRRFVCPRCYSRNLEPYQCAHTGSIVTFWVDNVGFPAVGYEDIDDRIIAIIRLDDGIHVISEVVDISPGEVHNGQRVRMVVRRHKREDTGNWCYGFKFTPHSH